MGHRPTGHAALALALVVTSLAAPSGAQVPFTDDANQHLRRGVELTDARNHAAALVEFSRAYELSRNPLLLYNVGASHLALGNFVEALEAFQRYLAEAPPAAVAARRPLLDASMARIRQFIGVVAVAVDAPGLTVRVDGVERDPRQARRGIPVSTGRHRVALAAPGRVAREDAVDVASGQRVEVTEDLVRVTSSLTVSCNVPNAEVLVDGRVAGLTPVGAALAVDEGAHRVELRRAGYVTYSTLVEVHDRGARVEAELAWSATIAPDVAARLIVVASEPDAVASLDGRRIPLDGSEPLPPGAHRLRVERRDFLTAERLVTLEEGGARVERVEMVPTAARLDGLRERARSARRDAWIVTSAGAAALIGGALGVGLATLRLDALVEERDQVDARLNTCMVASMLCSGSEWRAARERTNAISESEIPTMDVVRVTSAVVASVGLVGLAVGVVMHLRVPSPARSAADTGWRLAIGLDHVGVAGAF